MAKISEKWSETALPTPLCKSRYNHSGTSSISSSERETHRLTNTKAINIRDNKTTRIIAAKSYIWSVGESSKTVAKARSNVTDFGPQQSNDFWI